MRQETRFKFNAYLTQLAKLNGISVDDVSKKIHRRAVRHANADEHRAGVIRVSADD